MFWRASSLTDYDLSARQNKQTNIVFALHAEVGSLEPEKTPRNEQRGNTGSFCTKKIRLDPSFVRWRSLFLSTVFLSFLFGLPFELKLTTVLYFQITFSLLF